MTGHKLAMDSGVSQDEHIGKQMKRWREVETQVKYSKQKEGKPGNKKSKTVQNTEI